MATGMSRHRVQSPDRLPHGALLCNNPSPYPLTQLQDRTLLCGTRDPKECTNITTFSAERLVTSFVVMSDVAIRWERRSR